MSVRVGIDVGGTFTDVCVQRGDQIVRGKSDTTAYDLRVGFMNALAVASAELDSTVDDLLRDTEDIVYSTTVGTNALIEHNGPRLGLITTAGFEDTLVIGRARSWADGREIAVQHDRGRARKPAPLVPREMTAGVRERLDSHGRIVRPLDDDDALAAIQRLVDAGARGFVVVLHYSYIDGRHERRIRELIREQYPPSYLGYMPVFLSSEVSPIMGEYRRTLTCVLDAYLRMGTEEHLVALGDDLRSRGYKRPLLLAKCTGGASSPSRTRPIHLFGSGPVAGIIGAKEIAASRGLDDVVVTDMGGTSFDVGLIVGGREQTSDADPMIESWRVQVPLVAHWSIGAGGGSIARVEFGALRVGPESAKAMPGPAAYGRGGTAPTVTDADIVLGFVDPDYFLGGRVRLDRDLALDAIRPLASALEQTVDEAAWGIRSLVDATMGQEVYRIVAQTSGLDPRDFTAVALGGAGPVHAAGVAEAADIARVMVLPFGSVSGAYGTLNLALLQTYERSISEILRASGTGSIESGVVERINRAIAELVDLANRDMAEEVLDDAVVELRLEWLMRFGQQRQTLPVQVPAGALETVDEIDSAVRNFVEAYAAAYGTGAVFLEAGVELLGLRLTALGAVDVPRLPVEGASPEPTGPIGRRSVYWGPVRGRVETPVYRVHGVPRGSLISGPALIESDDTVCVVPPGWDIEVDEQQFGWLTRQPGGNNRG